jgi:hypothetical protein
MSLIGRSGDMCRILGAGRSIAVFAIVVDAKDDRAVAFHKGFGCGETEFRLP